LINEDNHLLEEMMFSHNASKYNFEDQLEPIFNTEYEDFKANFANISSKEEFSKLKD